MALVIYSSRTGRIRRIMTDDNPARPDKILRHLYPPGAGESAVIVKDPPKNLARLQRRVNRITGKTPDNDRYVVFGNAGVVTRVFIGDPDAGDNFPNRTVRRARNARRGWRRNQANTSWERSLNEIDADLARANDRKTFINSQAWTDFQLAKGEATDAEIDARRAARNAQVDTRIANLTAEKTAREGGRPA